LARSVRRHCPRPDDLVIAGTERAHDGGDLRRERDHQFVNSSSDGGPIRGNDRTLIILAVLRSSCSSRSWCSSAPRCGCRRRDGSSVSPRSFGRRHDATVSVMRRVEALVAAISGVTIGFCLYFVTKPALVHVPSPVNRFRRATSRSDSVDVLVVAIGVPIAAAVVARVALRRVQLSPLRCHATGSRRSLRAHYRVSSHRRYRRPRVLRLRGPPDECQRAGPGLPPRFFLTMLGLVLAGPWLIMTGFETDGQSDEPCARATRRTADCPTTRRDPFEPSVV